MKKSSQIRILQKNLIDQISAGEVIEGPASVVKELLDNSIDAQANFIQVEILSKDTRSLRVTDNGLGIQEKDLELAFVNHATSKINSIEDLLSLKTKGFRGEALASISSVSDLVCLTKHKDFSQAFKIYFDQDLNLKKTKIAFNQGTCFEIRDIFSKVPARLKFLKNPETETQKIYQVVRELAIAHKEISFELKNRGKLVFKTLANWPWEKTIRALYRDNFDLSYFENLREKEPFMQVKGYLAPLSAATSNPKSIVTIINNRPIFCSVIRKAIRYLYQGLLPQGKYPRLFLSLTLNPEEVDFNVHPTKKEVRYQNGDILYRLVLSSLEKVLILKSKAPKIEELKREASISIESKNQIQNKKNIFEQNSEKEEKFKLFDSEVKNEIKIDSHSQKVSQLISSVNLRIFKKTSMDFRSSIQETLILETELFYVLGKLDFENDSNLNLYLDFLEKYVKELERKQQKTNNFSKNNHVQQQIFETFRPQRNRKKISLRDAEKTWQKFNWRCAYCGKFLLDPFLVKALKKQSKKIWVQRLNKQNKIVKINLLREHQATIDHLLPVANHRSLEQSSDNFIASCFSCNQEKLSSQDYYRWKPKIYPEWPEKLKISDLLIYGGQKDAKFTKI